MSADAQSARLAQLVKLAELARTKSRQNDVLEYMLKMLSQGRVSSVDGNIEEALCHHGHVFTRELPARIRRGPMKRCFLNAFNAADSGRGTYVEGFALTQYMLVHHAWITRDGEGAVEVTWGRKTSASYYGIPFRHDLLLKIAGRTGIAQVFGDTRTLPLREVLDILRS